MRAGVKPRRRARSGQSGFTLVELLVSVIILALIGVSIAAAFTVGFHVLGNRADTVNGTTTTAQMSTGDLTLSPSWPTTTNRSGIGNTWTKLVSVQVTQLLAGARNPVSTTFRVVPMVDDPLAFPPGSTTPPC